MSASTTLELRSMIYSMDLPKTSKLGLYAFMKSEYGKSIIDQNLCTTEYLYSLADNVSDMFGQLGSMTEKRIDALIDQSTGSTKQTSRSYNARVHLSDLYHSRRLKQKEVHIDHSELAKAQKKADAIAQELWKEESKDNSSFVDRVSKKSKKKSKKK